jgi:hypothetical protein
VERELNSRLPFCSSRFPLLCVRVSRGISRCRQLQKRSPTTAAAAAAAAQGDKGTEGRHEKRQTGRGAADMHASQNCGAGVSIDHCGPPRSLL